MFFKFLFSFVIFALQAEAQFVKCLTTVGDFTITMHREWAPLGYDRFMELVEDKYFDDQIFYRVIPGFLVQFGVAAKPEHSAKWMNKKPLQDDPQKNIPFTHGTVSFAGSGKNSRNAHIFISLDPQGQNLGNAHHERPFGRIEDENQQNVITKLYSDYNDLTRFQGKLIAEGNVALKDFPKLDRIKTCFIEPEEVDPAEL